MEKITNPTDLIQLQNKSDPKDRQTGYCLKNVQEQLIFSFIGLWVWAWSRKRKPAFHAASMLPLEEDNGQILDREDSTDVARPTGKGVNHVN